MISFTVTRPRECSTSISTKQQPEENVLSLHWLVTSAVSMYGTVQGIEGGVRYHGQVEEHGLPAAYHNLTVFYVQHIR